jgi:hypothetical protein
MGHRAKDKLGTGMVFGDWPQKLQAEGWLTPGLRESYRQIIGEFVEFCRQRQAGGTVALARDFVEVRRQGQAPSASQLQVWKDALNWYFRHGQEERRAGIVGVPPLASSDLGQPDWEQRLIARLRLLRLSWRTEKTYRGWAWRLAQFLAPRPLPTAGGAEVRALLTKLAVEERVSVATQKQALNALVFYLRDVEGTDSDGL